MISSKSHAQGGSKNIQLVGAWALPLWKMMEFVSWDYELPNIWKNKSHVPVTTNEFRNFVGVTAKFSWQQIRGISFVENISASFWVEFLSMPVISSGYLPPFLGLFPAPLTSSRSPYHYPVIKRGGTSHMYTHDSTCQMLIDFPSKPPFSSGMSNDFPMIFPTKSRLKSQLGLPSWATKRCLERERSSSCLTGENLIDTIWLWLTVCHGKIHHF